jgi:hypothetical protein
LAERIKTAFRLSVQRALAVALTHYDIDLKLVSSGYIVAPGLDGDAVAATMDEADADVEGFAAALSKKLEDDLPLFAEDDVPEDPQGEEGTCRKSGPRSPCKRVSIWS